MVADDEARNAEVVRPLLPYPVRLISSVSVISLPLAAILGGFAANAGVSPGSALLSWCVVTGLCALVIRWHLLREWLSDQQAATRFLPEATSQVAAIDLPFHTVLDSVNLPVLMFDDARQISFGNRAAEAVLGTLVPGKDIATAIRNPEMLSAVDSVMNTGDGMTVEFRRNQPVNRLLHARIEALSPEGGGSSDYSYIVIIDDMTDSERLREVRSGFVADVSHELRTPLAAVLSIVETLNGAAKQDAEAQSRFMVLLEEQASRMARIVDDLLSLSRIEMNEHRPPEGVAELGNVIGSIVESARMLADERGVRIDVQQKEPVTVPGDALELSRLFQNLVDNAVKYGSAESTVVIVVRAADDRAIVSIRDRGAGIEREHIPRLTERFYRVDKGRSRAAGGTGLGLAIVKHVVSRHRGRLKIESDVGKGSTFTVELPLAPG